MSKKNQDKGTEAAAAKTGKKAVKAEAKAPKAKATPVAKAEKAPKAPKDAKPAKEAKQPKAALAKAPKAVKEPKAPKAEAPKADPVLSAKPAKVVKAKAPKTESSKVNPEFGYPIGITLDTPALEARIAFMEKLIAKSNFEGEVLVKARHVISMSRSKIRKLGGTAAVRSKVNELGLDVGLPATPENLKARVETLRANIAAGKYTGDVLAKAKHLVHMTISKIRKQDPKLASQIKKAAAAA